MRSVDVIERALSNVIRVMVLAACAFAHVGTAGAQQWNDPRTVTLVRQATDRRVQQLADSGLVDYQARAHGYLTFLAQLGEGFQEPPRVVKADELALQVYWRAPNLSKQRIIGRRDTTLLPTDIAYHRDHLGIVQNNFPAIIRLGDGDEVRDVPHPLSPGGLAEYDFAISDSLRITIPGRVIGVYEVKVRPRDDRQPRVIGALYLDRDNGQVVRMALSFTRAAFLDKQLEDLFVVIENALVGTRFWLPRRQEIEIRRTATWLDYPVRGIIRGRWEISDYELNTGLQRVVFAGPEIVAAPLAEQSRYPWSSARILDSLPPEVRAVTAEEIRRVQAEARALVREQALQRARGSALAARGISDFVRFNRVEGLALGAGASAAFGSGFGISARGRFGLEDERAKGHAQLNWQRATGARIRAFVYDDSRDVGGMAERSLVVNSFAAQELGSDYTDPVRARGFGVGLGTALGEMRWTLEVGRESQEALALHARPASGAFEATLAAASLRGTRGSLKLDQPTRLGWLDFEFRGQIEVSGIVTESDVSAGCALPARSCDGTRVVRLSLMAEAERPIGRARLFSRTFGGRVSGSDYLHVQDLLYFGGPVSVPGYRFHELRGDKALGQRLEMQLPIPFPSIGLGRFGRSGATATLTPHATAIHFFRTAETLRFPGSPSIARSSLASPDPLGTMAFGTHGSAGASLIFGFDLLRLDVSRGFTRGRRWIVSFDVSRAFWSVL